MALSTTSLILARIAQELRDEVSTDTTDNRLLARLNEAYVDIISGGANLNDSYRGLQAGKPFIFSWAVSQTPIIVNTEAPVTSLTATINKGSATLTLSATYATSLAGWFIKLGSDEEWYRISAHTAGTDSLTLDKAYVEENASAESSKIVKLDYTFGSDILLPTNGLIVSYHDEPIPILDKREFEKYGVLSNLSQGKPTAACVIKHDGPNKSVIIRLNKYPENVERLELPYVPYPTELDTSTNNPILPVQHNQILVDLVTAIEYDLRDDTMSDKYFKRARDRFKVMKSQDRQFTAFQDPNYAKILAWSRSPDSLKGSIAGGHPNRQQNYQG